MSKYYRYNFLKKYYPDYIIFITNKNKLITYDYDLKIVKLFNYKLLNINYIILDNIDIIKKIDNKIDNKIHNYFYYFKITLLIDIINTIRKK